MKVTTKCDIGTIPQGSVIRVEKTLKNHYRGLWSSCMGTYPVKVKKSDCKRYAGSPYAKLIKKALADPKNRARVEKLEKAMKKLHP